MCEELASHLRHKLVRSMSYLVGAPSNEANTPFPSILASRRNLLIFDPVFGEQINTTLGYMTIAFSVDFL
jgi:hypothetical protein